MANHYHKLKKIFIETRLKGKDIDFSMKPSDIVRMAEQENNLYKYNENTFFCCYKTKYEDKPSILILFSLLLPGPPSGSSAASEEVMNLVEIIERNFSPIVGYFFDREADSKSRNIGLIRMVREIRDNDKFS